MLTQTLAPDADGVAQAAALLRQGQLVAFPTETVYGLGADATSDAAVAAIYAAKGRPSYNPLIVHLADPSEAARYAVVDAAARAVMQAFWPGPLTLVLPKRADAGLAPAVSAGLSSVALRVPDHDLARRVLSACQRPLAAPSANPSGRVSPTTAAHVLDGLSGRIAAVIDGGACRVGVESTVLRLSEAGPQLLRPGAVAADQIEAVLGRAVAVPGDEAVPSAPGQLASHYAPRARVILNAASRPEGALWLGFGPGSVGADATLSAVGDLTEAAARLFGLLRDLDAQAAGGQAIAVAPVPDTGLGRAINDRLRRAAAPR